MLAFDFFRRGHPAIITRRGDVSAPESFARIASALSRTVLDGFVLLKDVASYHVYSRGRSHSTLEEIRLEAHGRERRYTVSGGGALLRRSYASAPFYVLAALERYWSRGVAVNVIEYPAFSGRRGRALLFERVKERGVRVERVEEVIEGISEVLGESVRGGGVLVSRGFACDEMGTRVVLGGDMTVTAVGFDIDSFTDAMRILSTHRVIARALSYGVEAIYGDTCTRYIHAVPHTATRESLVAVGEEVYSAGIRLPVRGRTPTIILTHEAGQHLVIEPPLCSLERVVRVLGESGFSVSSGSAGFRVRGRRREARLSLDTSRLSSPVLSLSAYVVRVTVDGASADELLDAVVGAVSLVDVLSELLD